MLLFLEQVIIGLLFLWACRQLWHTIRPSTASGCSKGCGDACPATQLQDRLAEAEAHWKADQSQ